MPNMPPKGFSNLLLPKDSIHFESPKLLSTSDAVLPSEIIAYLLSNVSTKFEMLSAVKSTVSQHFSYGDSSKTTLLPESTAKMLFRSSTTAGLLYQINFLFASELVPRMYLRFSFTPLLSTYDDEIIVFMW